MKKSVLSVIALVAAIAALCCSVFFNVTFSSRLALLEARINDLTGQLDALQAEAPEAPAVPLVIHSWELLPEIREGGSVAVTLNAVSQMADPAVGADLLIQLNGQTLDVIPCVRMGDTFTATVNLEPANGYGYFCRLTDGSGGQETFALTTPEHPDPSTLVNLADSISSYGNMVVDGWTADDDALTLDLVLLQLQLPLLGREAPAVSAARLALYADGEAVSSADVSLVPGEGERSFEAQIQQLSLALPALEEGTQLEVYLEADLSDGQNIRSYGAGWFVSGGTLEFIVG